METNKDFFVEIGAGCFETLVYLAKEKGWEGLVVEPVPEYFKMIERVKGVYYENSAIGSETKNVPFYYVTQKTIKQNDLGDWMRGVGSVNKAHIQYPEKNATQITVPMLTVKDLLKKYDVKKIDYLKIDAEGLDCEILKQFDISPIRHIVFEWRNCTKAEIDREMERLIRANFTYKVEMDNIIAHKNI